MHAQVSLVPKSWRSRLHLEWVGSHISHERRLSQMSQIMQEDSQAYAAFIIFFFFFWKFHMNAVVYQAELLQ